MIKSKYVKHNSSCLCLAANRKHKHIIIIEKHRQEQRAYSTEESLLTMPQVPPFPKPVATTLIYDANITAPTWDRSAQPLKNRFTHRCLQSMYWTECV